MPRFVSIGECMVEMAEAGDGTFRRGFAGDTFNTAWYARRELPPDWTVGYATRIGSDAISTEMRAFFRAAGIADDHVRADPDRTVGLYLISLQDGERSFAYWRGQSAARRLADDPDWLDEVARSADALYFSGITLAILPPSGRERLCEVMRAARDRGATVAFDTNIRPALWDSEQAMRDGLERGASAAGIVFPSFDEEAALFGDKTPAATAARYGAPLAVVKNSADEVCVWDRGRITHLSPEPVRPVDTTAAGDSFAAAFLAAHLTGATPAEAARSATRLSAKVIMRRGALVETEGEPA